VVHLTLETASLDSGSPKRDEQLRAGDFFDADSHPDLVFHLTSASCA
jgi:polyisoprenoid-binding protein YceI